MSEFFRPLRRKCGILTLAVACAFTIAWIRSLRIADQFTMAGSKTSLVIQSDSGYMKCEVRRALGNASFGLFENREFWKSFDNVMPDPVPASEAGIHPIDLFNTKEREFLGFVTTSGSMAILAGPANTNEIRADSFACPHAYMVVLLTIFSAYLLLSKLRQKPSAPEQDVHQ